MVAPAALSVPSRRNVRPSSDPTLRSLLGICGSLIALFGVVLTIASAVSSMDSGMFFLFAGLGLVISGAFFAKRNMAGVWTYMAVCAATLAWSLNDAGLGGSSVAYRILGPIIMLCVLGLMMPALRRVSRARTVSLLSVLIIATVLVADLSDGSDYSPADPALAASEFHYAQTKGVLK